MAARPDPRMRGRAKATRTTDYRSDYYVARREQGWTQTRAREDSGISRKHAHALDVKHGFSTRAKQRERPQPEPHAEATQDAPHLTPEDLALDRDLDRDRASALPPPPDAPAWSPTPFDSARAAGLPPETPDTVGDLLAFVEGLPPHDHAWGEGEQLGPNGVERYRVCQTCSQTAWWDEQRGWVNSNPPPGAVVEPRGPRDPLYHRDHRDEPGPRIDLAEVGVGFDGLPAHPDVYAPPSQNPVALARARRAQSRDRYSVT